MTQQEPCQKCGQVDCGQFGEYPCDVCGLPTLHDEHSNVRKRSMWRENNMEKLWQWVAYHLPRRVVYFAAIRAWAYATTGKYSSEVAPAVTMDRVLIRWEEMP